MPESSDSRTSILWNIKDAHEALVCAISMRNWGNVCKYAEQLKVLDERLYNISTKEILNRLGTYSNVG